MISNIFFIALALGALVCAVLISVADFRRRIIPDAYLWPMLLAGLMLAAWCPWWPVSARMAAISGAFGYALAAGVGFLFDAWMRRDNPDATPPIGGGDIKLIATGGVFLGASGLSIALIVACVAGAIWARVRGQRYIPFAPFFVLGGILALIIMAFLI